MAVLTYVWYVSLYCLVGAVSLVMHEGCDTWAMRKIDDAPTDRAGNIGFALLLLTWPIWLVLYAFLIPLAIYKGLVYVVGGFKDWI